jgi:hypothetical protein
MSRSSRRGGEGVEAVHPAIEMAADAMRRELEPKAGTDLAVRTRERTLCERVCAACGEVESVHIMPFDLARLREAERRGEGLVVAVQGISLRGSTCWECKGECLGHPWHHFVWHAAEVTTAPKLEGEKDG